MADDNMKPVAGSVPPPANPIAKPRASTLKLKPVIRKPTIGGATGLPKPGLRPGMKLPTQVPAAKSEPAAAAPAAEQPGALEQLKTVTQKLKGVTQEIPQQAILRKTGIIADQDLTEAQKQASKSRAGVLLRRYDYPAQDAQDRPSWRGPSFRQVWHQEAGCDRSCGSRRSCR